MLREIVIGRIVNKKQISVKKGIIISMAENDHIKPKLLQKHF